MKIKVAVLMGAQGVFEVDVKEVAPGEFVYIPTLFSSIDINATCISGAEVALTETVKERASKHAEQALATIIGQNWKPAEPDNKDRDMVAKTVN